MNIDVRFTHGQQTIALAEVSLVAHQAARIPTEHRQQFFDVMLWRTPTGGVLVALLPRFGKVAWRWICRPRLGVNWKKADVADNSSPGRWICRIRRSSTPERKGGITHA